MGWLKDTSDFVFGGMDDKTADDQKRANELAQQFIVDQMQKARHDAARFTGRGDVMARRGYNKALGATKGSTLDSLLTMSRGNKGAQNMLLAGLPQIQNAIMGRPVDMSQLRNNPQRNLLSPNAISRIQGISMPDYVPLAPSKNFVGSGVQEAAAPPASPAALTLGGYAR